MKCNNNWSPSRVLPAEVKVMAENNSVSERRKSGVVRVRFTENASDKPERHHDFKTGEGWYEISPLEKQRRFLAALHKDGFVPFDGDEDGTQFWRRPA